MMGHVELEQRRCFVYHYMDDKPVVVGHRLANNG